jgi:hypothetical protein
VVQRLWGVGVLEPAAVSMRINIRVPKRAKTLPMEAVSHPTLRPLLLENGVTHCQ